MICRSRYIRTQKSQTCQSNINKQIISSSNLINKPNNYKMMFHVSNQQFYNKTSKNQLLQEKSTKSYCFPAGTCCCRFRRPRPRRCHLLRLRRFGQFVFGGGLSLGGESKGPAPAPAAPVKQEEYIDYYVSTIFFRKIKFCMLVLKFRPHLNTNSNMESQTQKLVTKRNNTKSAMVILSKESTLCTNQMVLFVLLNILLIKRVDSMLLLRELVKPSCNLLFFIYKFCFLCHIFDYRLVPIKRLLLYVFHSISFFILYLCNK